jgi:uncharacterized protein (TIGR00730 family)
MKRVYNGGGEQSRIWFIERLLIMKCVCVFAGSSPGKRPIYQEEALKLGQALVARGLALVYGGGSVGLMGILADAVLGAGGEAIGVIPQGLLLREEAHRHLTKLYTVKSMHERKALMSNQADAFIALPGGFGTFDELFEIITWAQLGIHQKPIGLLNVANYFTPLLTLVQHASDEGFIAPVYTGLLQARETVGDVLDALASFTPIIRVSNWPEPPPEE